MSKYTLILEQWDLPYLYQEREQVLFDSHKVIEVINVLQEEKCATLHIEKGNYTLNINASYGLFAIGVQTQDDNYFDRVGDGFADGSVQYVVSGQIVNFPRRYLLTLNQVIDNVELFLATDTVDFSDGKWE